MTLKPSKPISSAKIKITFGDFFCSLFLTQLVNKIKSEKKKIDIIEFSEGGDFWTSIFKDFYFKAYENIGSLTNSYFHRCNSLT